MIRLPFLRCNILCLCILASYVASAQDSSLLLREVVVFGKGIIDLQKDRKTPIAVSTFSGNDIRQEESSTDLISTLAHSPSVFVGTQAGGFGSSHLSIRGFQQNNIALLLNGQPINDMESGKTFWSDWMGFADIVETVQIQRGLGSSKLAISSVGGTINFVTAPNSTQPKGIASVLVGNNHFLKVKAGYNSGISAKGWGINIILSHWQGDGYVDGTQGQGQNYFISVAFKPNTKHAFNFLVTGSPQWADQNFAKPISNYLTYGRTYNKNWGIREGEYLSERRYFYHKPIVNLNWDWTINSKSHLATVLYASWGRGGGTGPTSSANVIRTATDQIDWDKMVAINQKSSTGSVSALFNFTNNHFWCGVVSNYVIDLTPRLHLNVGIDLRKFEGTQFLEIANLLGGEYVASNSQLRYQGRRISTSFSINPWDGLGNYANEADRYTRDFDQYIYHAGTFSQIEYATSIFSVFLQGSFSYQEHRRVDRFKYTPENEASATYSYPGFNIKTGASYRVGTYHTVFSNVGYYSRQPYWENIFSLQNNNANPLAKNEEVFGVELGYIFKNSFIETNLHLYRTEWSNRIIVGSLFKDKVTGSQVRNTTAGVNQVHYGVELEAEATLLSNLSITGFCSWGDWRYAGNATVTTRDEQLKLVRGDSISNLDGGRVGDAAQFTTGLGINYKPISHLQVRVNWKLYDLLFANVVTKNNIQLPAYHLTTVGASYTIPLGHQKKQTLSLNLNINNFFDEFYISDMNTANPVTNKTQTYQGISTDNQVFIGWGRTYSFALVYDF